MQIKSLPVWWKNFNAGSIPGFNQWLLTSIDMCNVVSGFVLHVCYRFDC